MGCRRLFGPIANPHAGVGDQNHANARQETREYFWKEKATGKVEKTVGIRWNGKNVKNMSGQYRECRMLTKRCIMQVDVSIFDFDYFIL